MVVLAAAVAQAVLRVGPPGRLAWEAQVVQGSWVREFTLRIKRVA